MGRGTVLTSLLGSTAVLQSFAAQSTSTSSLPHLPPRSLDDLLTVNGLKTNVLLKWQDTINPQGDQFGFNNDFIAFLPGKSADHGYLWVNHEYIHPLFVSGYNPAQNMGVRKTAAQVTLEQKNVGGSFFAIQRREGQWTLDTQDRDNFRIDGLTPLSLVADRAIEKSKTAIGTTGNCCGGQTPWGTVLTCEENFHDFYGQVKFSQRKGKTKRHPVASSSAMAWDDHTPYPPEHYGWVVEINPRTKKGKKLTALGRFAHEGAFVVQAPDGRCVVYMGDDTQDQYFYKFIAAKKGSLEKGKLYVAILPEGKWEELSLKNPKLKGRFKDQTELLIRTREAATLLGATPLDRPEGCAQDPVSKSIYLNCTMNKEAGRPFGSIMKFDEENHDPLSLKFKSEIFLHGGELTGFACPDNMCFDRKGNLWMTTDVADYDLNKDEYKPFGNNSLFYIPLSGPEAGKAFRFAIAPQEAEFTGPCFSADGKTLFLSVQHPGANTKDLKEPTSHWPEGGSSLPKPAVITISGPLLDRLVGDN